jgi:hypothetical protein
VAKLVRHPAKVDRNPADSLAFHPPILPSYGGQWGAGAASDIEDIASSGTDFTDAAEACRTAGEGVAVFTGRQMPRQRVRGSAGAVQSGFIRCCVFGNDLKRPPVKAANANVNAYAAFFHNTRKRRFDNLRFRHSRPILVVQIIVAVHDYSPHSRRHSGCRPSVCERLFGRFLNFTPMGVISDTVLNNFSERSRGAFSPVRQCPSKGPAQSGR